MYRSFINWHGPLIEIFRTSGHQNISYTITFIIQDMYVTNSVFVTTVKKYWIIWSYFFIFHYSSRNSHEEIRQMNTDYFLSISIILDFRCCNFDDEIFHKCLDASRLLFVFRMYPNLKFLDRFLPKHLLKIRPGKSIWSLRTDGRTDGRQTEMTQLPTTVHL